MMNTMKKLLLTMLAVIAAQSCFAGLMQHHVDNCYVSTDKCKLLSSDNYFSISSDSYFSLVFGE